MNVMNGWTMGTGSALLRIKTECGKRCVKFMNRKGYTLLEFLLALLIAVTVLTILSLLIRSLAVSLTPTNERLNMEAFVMKVERDLWRVAPSDLLVEEQKLSYTTQSRTRYTFYVENQSLIMEIGTVGKERYVWMDGILTLNFFKTAEGICIYWSDVKGREYENTIFYAWH